MRAELKFLHSPDVDLDSYYPEDPSNFSFLLQAMIGIEGKDGHDSFDIMVYTPQWLLQHHNDSDVVFGRHTLIVFDYDIGRLRAAISRYCEYTFGDDWLEIAERLARIGYWEFEDYAPDPK